ncbi:MAG: STAS domain-containing protein [Gammaproteobacteria bacterium]|nr:MAG: STAS domain-containing protein [Gammaproteobacteria bacterium]
MLDNGATCVAYTEANNKILEEQTNTLIQLSTPTIQLWEGILLLPIVGVLDSIRSQNMMEELLKRTVQTSSPVSIIDIVGVANVDSSVANHLIKIVRSAKLLGNTCILSGLSPEVAQTLVEVGVDLEGINTTSNLRNALKLGLEIVNMTIKENHTNKNKEKEETYEIL